MNSKQATAAATKLRDYFAKKAVSPQLGVSDHAAQMIAVSYKHAAEMVEVYFALPPRPVIARPGPVASAT